MAEIANMGPGLNGWSPPFTPSGKSAYMPIAGVGYPGITAVHNGILITFETADGELAKLLPAPLNANNKTKTATIFINQTILMPSNTPDIGELEPDATVFHEALITFPCELDGEPLAFHYIQYTDSDWCAYNGVVVGLTSKMSRIRLMAPEPTAHPMWSLDRQGSVLKASVSRDGERLITATFRMGPEIEDRSEAFSDAGGIVGMRYFPDAANMESNTPLVHDLVGRIQGDFDRGPVYSGEATLSFGNSVTDELDFFQPTRIVSAYYITNLSHTNRAVKVLYDYLK
jgi:hypothetical protein